MIRLQDLEGVSEKFRDAEFITSSKQISAVLRKGLACTSAEDNGAINIWKDDKGNIRCNAMRWCSSIDYKTFKRVADAKKWADKWLIEIGVTQYVDKD